jgi:glycosyltransferase involved in cell wall biosynthesis
MQRLSKFAFLVVDNGSTDGTAEIIRGYPQVEVTRLK